MAELTTVTFAFYAAAVILAIGFTGNMLFRRTGFPEILFLVFFGMVLGPLLGVFKQESLIPILPYLSTLAFMMILFNGGLDLNLRQLISQSTRATILAVTYFIFVTLAVTLFARFFFEMDWILAMMFGPMIAGTSSVVIIPLVNRIGVNPDTATTLAVESAITDILNVIFLFVLLDLQIGGVFDIRQAGTDLVSRFSVGIVLGLILGMVWLRILYATRNEEFTYISTLATLIGGFQLSESLGGSGVLTALVLGVIMGNDADVLRVFPLRIKLQLLEETKRFIFRFQGEMAFLMRSFFFVFLGLIYNPTIAVSTPILLASFIMLGINLALRYIAATLATFRSQMSMDKATITVMSGQGLAHAALSLVPLQFGLPNAFVYVAVVINVIILTNIVTSVSAAYIKYRAKERLKATKGIPSGPLIPPTGT